MRIDSPDETPDQRHSGRIPRNGVGLARRNPLWGGRHFALAVSVAVLAGSLWVSPIATLQAHFIPIPGRSVTAAIQPGEAPGVDSVPTESQGDNPEAVTGIVEAIPQNIYHASPYNDWPLFEVKVREGQRLKFRREQGAWTGDRSALFTQFETPAEIDGKKEDVEIAALEVAAAETTRDVLRTELAKELEAATIRERNARQVHERLERLGDRRATTQQEVQQARNTLDLAVSQREGVASRLGKKVKFAEIQADLAEHRLRRARSELLLADFKRDMSWGSVPVARGRFEEVVVTKVRGIRGDVPTAASRREAWVEVIDDRVLNVRAELPARRTPRLAIGREVAVHQDGRQYGGRVAGVGIVADPKSRLVSILVEVQNADRELKINTVVAVKFGPR